MKLSSAGIGCIWLPWNLEQSCHLEHFLDETGVDNGSHSLADADAAV